MIFKKDNAFILNSENDIIAVADRQGDLYYVRETKEGNRQEVNTEVVKVPQLKPTERRWLKVENQTAGKRLTGNDAS